MLRVIREVKPQWVVGENVRGLLNWNGGLVFHEVCADLENIGYEVQAFIIPASGLNAPHQRERLWVVAHSNGNECNKRGQSINGREINKLKNGSEIWDKSTQDGKQRDVADTKVIGRKNALENRKLERGRFRFGNKSHTWNSFPSQYPVCGGDDGISNGLDNITFSKWRNESIKGYGNAVVPQVVYRIFKTIEYIQNLK
jgi:DNA (cytosine-5)-methyltransferase 1